MYGFLVRNCRSFRDIECIKKLYISYVRSILEYAAIVWNPIYENHKYAVEKVQNKFLRYLYFKEAGTYDLNISKNELRKRYKLFSLDKRRVFSCVMFLYKLLHNEIDDELILSEINLNVPSHRTRNSVTFYLKPLHTNNCMNAPINAMCRYYNDLVTEFDIFHLSKSNLKTVLIDLLYNNN